MAASPVVIPDVVIPDRVLANAGSPTKAVPAAPAPKASPARKNERRLARRFGSLLARSIQSSSARPAAPLLGPQRRPPTRLYRDELHQAKLGCSTDSLVR